MNVLRQVAEEMSENPNTSSTPSLPATCNGNADEEKFAHKQPRIIEERADRTLDHHVSTRGMHLPVWVDICDHNVEENLDTS